MSFIDEDFIPESGALFNFGEIGYEELISKIWIKNDPVKEFSCGDQFVVLVTISGRVFSYGKNDWGQLGLGDIKATTNPCCIKSLKNSGERAVYVGCGRCHTLISTESNKLFGFGSNTEGQLGLNPSIRCIAEPNEITLWDAGPIKQLGAGGEFSAALTEGGDIYIWGSNSEGQLGLNEIDEDLLWQPTKLKFFTSPITSLSCGAYHMGAITGGMLYMWGEASDGKLGLGDNLKSNQNFPQKVSLKASVKELACGNTHSLCLTSSGVVYVWGTGESGQLGLGPYEVIVTKPTMLKLPNKIVNSYGDNKNLMEKFNKISVGERHTAIINANGLIFTFGDGRHGKLGNLDGSISYGNYLWPTLIEKLSNDEWVEDVRCGGCHTVVLVRHRLVHEQLDEVSSTYRSSTIRTNDELTYDSSPGRTRRHKRNNLNKDNDYETNNLPKLKSTKSLLNGDVELSKKEKVFQTNIEEQISDSKSTLLKSTPGENLNSEERSFNQNGLRNIQSDKNNGHNNEMRSSYTQDLENIQEEMRNHVAETDSLKHPNIRRESFNEKVDNFVALMDATFKEPVVEDQDCTNEIIRKKLRKKQKIKSVEAKPSTNDEFDQSVWKENELSGEEKDIPKSEINDHKVSTSEVTKVGCGRKQESGTCRLI